MGMLGTLFENHEEVIIAGQTKRKKLNRTGRIFLALTIAGGLMALTGQILESVKNSKKDKSMMEKLDSTARETLRLVAKIDTIDLEITIPISTTNTGFKQARDFLAERARLAVGSDVTQDNKQQDSEIPPRFKVIKIAEYSQRGYKTFNLVTASHENGLIANTALNPLKQYLSNFSSQKTQLRFGGFFSTAAFSDEILCALSPTITRAEVHVSTNSETMYLRIYANFGRENWKQLQPVVAPQDLAGLPLLITVPYVANDSDMSAIKVNLVINRFDLLLPDLKVLGIIPARGYQSGIDNGVIYRDDVDIEYPAGAEYFTAKVPNLR